MSNRAIKYRIYPTTEQAVMFAKTFGCCRKVYNLMLSDKIKSYEETKSFGRQTPAMYKADYPYLKEVDSLALANVQLNLQSALRNRFDKKRKQSINQPSIAGNLIQPIIRRELLLLLTAVSDFRKLEL